MIFADKLLDLRKKSGMSQEEFAAKMGVSRQSVSKWEGAQSVPDLDKILLMSQMFGVSTDYLLKDEMETAVFEKTADETVQRRLSMEDANAWLQVQDYAAKRISLGVLLCILSPIPLCISSLFGSAEWVIASVCLLICIVACAVALFVLAGFRVQPYEWIEKEPFQPEYGVEGLVREKQKAFRDRYVRTNISGVVLCVFSSVPLILSTVLESRYLTMLGLCILFVLVAIAVFGFVRVGVRWGAMQTLLQEGEYSREGKRNNALKERIGGIFWILVVAVYLGWSFLSGQWGFTWVVWPVAAILFGAVTLICDLATKKE